MGVVPLGGRLTKYGGCSSTRGACMGWTGGFNAGGGGGGTARDGAAGCAMEWTGIEVVPKGTRGDAAGFGLAGGAGGGGGVLIGPRPQGFAGGAAYCFLPGAAYAENAGALLGVVGGLLAVGSFMVSVAAGAQGVEGFADFSMS